MSNQYQLIYHQVASEHLVILLICALFRVERVVRRASNIAGTTYWTTTLFPIRGMGTTALLVKYEPVTTDINAKKAISAHRGRQKYQK